jgi:hypothetical protein
MSPSPVTVTLNGTQAFNLTNHSGNVTKFTPPQDGEYLVQANVSVNFHLQKLPLRQVFLFSTAPLTTGDSYSWYFAVGSGGGNGITIQLTMGNPIYVFLVDQVDSTDNTGTASVTFTYLNG